MFPFMSTTKDPQKIWHPDIVKYLLLFFFMNLQCIKTPGDLFGCNQNESFVKTPPRLETCFNEGYLLEMSNRLFVQERGPSELRHLYKGKTNEQTLMKHLWGKCFHCSN